jgi:membrane protease YdiL (CAAX protease family)
MTIPTTGTRSRLNAIFRGSNGLRTGWSVLLFLAIAAAVLVVIGHVAFMLHHPLPMRLAMTPGRLIFMESAVAIAVLTATVAMSRIERKSWLGYGWQGPRRAALLAQGMLAGLVLMSLLMCLLVLTHGATIRYGDDGWSVLTSGAAWVLGFALVALTEETMFRGYLFFLLANRRGPRFAAIIMSLAFGVAHLGDHGENVPGILQVVAFGLAMCLAVWRTGSLWWALGFHAVWDWSESFLFGAADSGNIMKGHLLTTYSAGPTWLSGGSAGPEGSLMVLPLLALMAIWIMFAVSRKPRTRVQDAPEHRDMSPRNQTELGS